MAQTAWKGFVSLGLLSIPVKLYVAAREDRIALNQLHKPCNSRIKMPRSCAVCNRDVKPEEIVKAYEYAKDHYLLLAEEEIEAIAPVSNHIMEIEATVKFSEVDPVYFGDSYYIAPEPAGAKAYSLLAKGLRDSKLVALAKLSRNQREIVMVIRPVGQGLMCHAMYYANEVRQVAEFQVITEAAVTPAEVKLATKLLASMEGPFEPENYEDGYQARLAELLDKKQKGETVTATPAPTPRAPAVDMLAALQASLDAAARKRARPAVQ